MPRRLTGQEQMHGLGERMNRERTDVTTRYVKNLTLAVAILTVPAYATAQEDRQEVAELERRVAALESARDSLRAWAGGGKAGRLAEPTAPLQLNQGRVGSRRSPARPELSTN